MVSKVVGLNHQDAVPSEKAVQRLTAFEATLKASASSEGVPGISGAALVEGQWQVTYYGIDDQRTGRPRDESSRQHGTCLNKVLIAYVALMLVDRKLVSLDEPLNELLPDAVRRRDGNDVEITLRQVLSHSSGIDESFEEWAPADAVDNASHSRRFERYPQIAEPGEIFAYSDAGTAIAALLIERLLGKPWRQSVNAMLLEPLGIKALPETTDFVAYYGGTVAVGHSWDDASEGLQPVTPDTSPAMADTLAERSTCFTITELAALGEFALADGITRQGERLISAELAREMRTKQVDVPGHHLIHSWGLGWMFFDETSFGFEAAGEGHENFVQIFPDQGVVLVMMANAYPAQVVYYDALRALQDSSWEDRPAQPIDPNACVGTYLSDGYKLVVTRGAKHLRYSLSRRVSTEIRGVMSPDEGVSDLEVSSTFRRHDAEIISNQEWQHSETGSLVPSPTGGFAARIGNKMRRGSSITPIWSGSAPEPKFFRFGQKVVRKIE
ncbi:serine hydrolase [Streptomyces mirabilis]|uniref:Serine hydrolase n=1 Tax=Streptomyces mirabilis TaxID=68239 RepID=A0ABU3V602_9ACTN|nr:serine hydrolase domain-containing protein [Streptomyces mirabilis]MCX5357043.1 beta-lactamase family protein [Streptomyces mirabilis]MDU9001580.1 serine hydrolase [Streptomyces mirabilis]